MDLYLKRVFQLKYIQNGYIHLLKNPGFTKIDKGKHMHQIYSTVQ